MLLFLLALFLSLPRGVSWIGRAAGPLRGTGIWKFPTGEGVTRPVWIGCCCGSCYVAVVLSIFWACGCLVANVCQGVLMDSVPTDRWWNRGTNLFPRAVVGLAKNRICGQTTLFRLRDCPPHSLASQDVLVTSHDVLTTIVDRSRIRSSTTVKIFEPRMRTPRPGSFLLGHTFLYSSPQLIVCRHCMQHWYGLRYL